MYAIFDEAKEDGSYDVQALLKQAFPTDPPETEVRGRPGPSFNDLRRQKSSASIGTASSTGYGTDISDQVGPIDSDNIPSLSSSVCTLSSSDASAITSGSEVLDTEPEFRRIARGIARHWAIRDMKAFVQDGDDSRL